MRQRFAIICKAGEVVFGELDADRALSRGVGWLKLRGDSRTIAEPERVDSEMATLGADFVPAIGAGPRASVISDPQGRGAGGHPKLNGISSETVATRRLPNYGSKMGIDATRKWKAEGLERPWPAMIEMDRGTKARVDALWEELGM